MDKDQLKDVTATTLGGGSGVDMIYTGIEGMLDGGVDAPEIKLVAYGLISVVCGFFAWRRSRKAAPVDA